MQDQPAEQVFITVLEMPTNQTGNRARELKQTDWKKLRIACNDKGLAVSSKT
jgi:hypothetical protein